MVLDFYKLQEHPFGVTPDSRYLFLSATHREALASLLYGVETGRGFVALIAEPGLGKTTLLFRMLEQLREKTRTVFLFQTVCTPMDLLRALLTGLGVRDPQGTLIQLQTRLREVLVEQFRLGKRVVVVIDEAQNLDDSVLELVRMLSNFETPREKLIQIILCGQTQLAVKIGSPELEQLRQRISMFAALQPFSREETQHYIEHRLRVAGYGFDMPLFTRDAMGLIAEHSGGIPREINNLCFNALSLGCALQRRPIDREMIGEVIADLDLGRFRRKGVAQRQEKEPASPAPEPAFLAAVSRQERLPGWAPKLAAVLALLLILGGVLVAVERWRGQKAVQAETNGSPAGVASQPVLPQPGPQPSVAETSTQPVVAEAARPAAAQRQLAAESVVSVAPGETLLSICTERFGVCSPEILEQIRKLNPRLNNPDHIETGQKIHLPPRPMTAPQSAEAPAMASKSASGEKQGP